MDFTQLYPASTTVISHDGSYILSSTATHLVLRDASSFQILQSWRNSNSNKPYTQLAFSPDSQYCLAVDTNSEKEQDGCALVFHVGSPEPVANIKPGSEGLQGARWLDQIHIACWSKHGIRMTVWNMHSGKQHIINSPKRSAGAGWAIHPPKQDYLAVLERHKSKDYLGIYGLRPFCLVRRVSLPTIDASDLSWSPCGRYIAIWENSLEYALHVLTPDGRLLVSHTLDNSSNVSGLGIRSVAWHPSGRFLAIGGYDEKIRILNDISWTSIAEIQVPGSVWSGGSSKKGGRILVHREPAAWLASPATSSSIVPFDLSSVPISSLHASHPASASTTSKPSTTISARTTAKDLGVTHLIFSPSGQYLCASLASSAQKLLIVRFVRCSEALPFTAARPRVLCVLAFNKKIARCAWRPARRRTSGAANEQEEDEEEEEEVLAITTGEKSIHLWRPTPALSGSKNGEEEDNSSETDEYEAIKPGTAEGVGIPSQTMFENMDVKWAQNGESMLLSGKDKFCLAYPLPES